MGTVKDVLLSYWDRIVFYRDDRTDARLGLIAESLPILEDVEQLKASGALDSGTADGIKKQVVDSVTMFAQAGATIPEIQNVAQYDPRKLMRPKAEMLVGPKDAEPVAKAAAKPAEPAAAPAAKPAAAVPAAEKPAARAYPQPSPPRQSPPSLTRLRSMARNCAGLLRLRSTRCFTVARRSRRQLPPPPSPPLWRRAKE